MQNMKKEQSDFCKILLLTGALSLAIAGSTSAKEKGGKSAPEIQIEQGATVQSGATGLDALVIGDAVRLCDLAVADDVAVLGALESGGWTYDLDRNVGNVPFYKELSADRFYDGVGNIAFWGFVENYPGVSMGYCSITITDPEIRFSIDSLDGRDNFVGEMRTNGEEVFGTWRNVSAQPSIFVQAYHNSDTFTYQITRINKLDN